MRPTGDRPIPKPRRRSARGGLALGLSALGLLALSACEPDGRDRGDRGPTDASAVDGLRVSAVFPAEGPIDLNQPITVWFDAPLDRRSVSPESFRVVSAATGEVCAGDVQVGTRRIEFRPVPPTTPLLDDGGLPPGGAIRIELVGFPSLHALRSRDGAALQRGRSIAFRVLAADQGRGGLPAPLLPSARAEEVPFELRAPSIPRVAGADPRLVLGLTRPVLPTSLGTEAFHVLRIVHGAPERVDVSGLRLLRDRDPLTGTYGTRVELSFAPGVLRAGDQLYVLPTPVVEHALRDYRGRVLAHPGREKAIPIGVDPGERVRLFEVGFDSIGLHPSESGVDGSGVDGSGPRRSGLPRVGFEVVAGSAVAHVLKITGDGRLGDFRPRQDTTLELYAREDVIAGRGNVQAFVGGDLQFHSIDIPAGVTVRVRSSAPVRLRASGSVRVAGHLVLETPPGERQGSSDIPGDYGASWEDLSNAPVTIFASAGIEVPAGGTIRHGDPASNAAVPMLGLASGGPMVLQGDVPYCYVRLERNEQIRGAHDGLKFVRPYALERGAPAGSRFEASAWSDWCELRSGVAGASVRVELVGVRGGLRIDCQTAAVDPILGNRPRTDMLRAPMPLSERFEVPEDARYVRFRIRGLVAPGKPLPAVRSLSFLRD